VNHTDKDILRIAIPAIVANITVPLLGLVDVTIAGHIGDEHYIGAIAIGSMVFNVVYWVLGFLRMGTSGLTAQADGRGDRASVAASLWRSLMIGELMGCVIVAMQHPFLVLAMKIMSPPEGVEALVRTYYNICVWGTPAMLGLYSVTGWLIGLRDTRVPMIVAIAQNVVNIAVSVWLVAVCGWGIEGVATGTLVAQWAGFIMALACIFFFHSQHLRGVTARMITDWAELRHFLGVNVFIFLRTLCLVSVNLFFVAYGSRQGAMLLAVNTLLMQFFTIYSYVMDGFAYAGEALCGYAAGKATSEGESGRLLLTSTVKRLFMWGILMAAVFTVAYAYGGNSILSLLTSQRDVVEAARPYFAYAVLIPAVGMAAFVWDGVFIGLTASRGMLLSCAIATAAFWATLYFLRPSMANHALWIAYLMFLLSRGIVQNLLFVRHIAPKRPHQRRNAKEKNKKDCNGNKISRLWRHI